MGRAYVGVDDCRRRHVPHRLLRARGFPGIFQMTKGIPRQAIRRLVELGLKAEK
jgi:hypothetical protein